MAPNNPRNPMRCPGGSPGSLRGPTVSRTAGNSTIPSTLGQAPVASSHATPKNNSENRFLGIGEWLLKTSQWMFNWLDAIAGNLASNKDAVLDFIRPNKPESVETKNAWSRTLTILSLSGLIVGFIGKKYHNDREEEKNCPFYLYAMFLKCLLELKDKQKLLELMQLDEEKAKMLIDFLELNAPPNANLTVRFQHWMRRRFCFEDTREKKQKLASLLLCQDQQTNQKEDIFLEILNRFALALNKTELGKYEVEVDEAEFGLRLQDACRKELSSRQDLIEAVLGKKSEQEKPNFDSEVKKDVFAQITFLYWIAFFVCTYLFPPLGLAIGGVAVLPFFAIGVFALIGCITKMAKITKGKEVDSDKNEKVEQKLEQQVIQALINKLLNSLTQTSSNQKDVCEQALNDEKVANQKDVCEQARNDEKAAVFYAKFKGFIFGSFKPFFIIWISINFGTLIFSCFHIGIVLTTGPIGIGIAIVALSLAIFCGVRSASKAGKLAEKRYADLSQNIANAGGEMQGSGLNKQKMFWTWTNVKKFINRAYVFVESAGYGSLFFRSILGKLITIVTLGKFLPVAIMISPVLPYIAIALLLATSLIFAVGFCHAYNINRRLERAEKACKIASISKIVLPSDGKGASNNDQAQDSAYSSSVESTQPIVIPKNRKSDRESMSSTSLRSTSSDSSDSSENSSFGKIIINPNLGTRPSSPYGSGNRGFWSSPSRLANEGSPEGSPALPEVKVVSCKPPELTPVFK